MDYQNVQYYNLSCYTFVRPINACECGVLLRTQHFQNKYLFKSLHMATAVLIEKLFFPGSADARLRTHFTVSQ